MKQKKVRKPSRDEIVATRIAAAIVAGAVLTVHAAYGYYTVGAYTPRRGAAWLRRVRLRRQRA